MVSVAVLARRVRRDIALSACAALVAMIGSSPPYGVLTDTPALVQRITFGVFLGWRLIVAAPLTVRAEPLN